MNSWKTHLILWPALAGAIVFAFLQLFPEESVRHETGVLCPDTPVQKMISDNVVWLKDDYLITALASYAIRARVLSVRYYSAGRESDLSPVDLALGWGKMSDQMIVDRLSISQSGRRWYWKTDVLPIPMKEINESAANVHILPGSDIIAHALEKVIRGDIVNMSGFLVKATADGRWRWVSSLRRDDTGDGACEVFWVTDFENETMGKPCVIRWDGQAGY